MKKPALCGLFHIRIKPGNNTSAGTGNNRPKTATAQTEDVSEPLLYIQLEIAITVATTNDGFPVVNPE